MTITGNLRRHAEACGEEELIRQIDDIGAMVEEMMSWRLKAIRCSEVLSVHCEGMLLYYT